MQSRVTVCRGTRIHQGAISPVAGLAHESTPFLRRTPVLTHSALTPFFWLKKCETFPDFFWKRAFQGNTGPTNSFHRDCNCELSCRGQGRKGQTPSACLFHTLGIRQVPICLLEFYFMVYLLWVQTKQCIWMNPSWNPSTDLCHCPIFFLLKNAIYSHYRYLWELIWILGLYWLAGLLGFIFFHSGQICEGC